MLRAAMFRTALSRASNTLVFRSGPRAIAIVLALLVMLSTQLQTQSTEINVGTNCTLAQAIREANGATGNTGSCTAGNNGAGAAGADVINMPSTADTLRLSATLPTISSTITINGKGWTISGDSDNDGDGDTRLFFVSYGKLTLNNMTLTKANTVPADLNGGAIRLFPGTLELNRVVMSDNQTVGHGAAIAIDHSSSSATIVDSRFSNNATTNSADAGAIYNHGSLSIRRSSFNGNSAHGTGFGGAISITSGSVSTTITNSTFYSNSARQGGAIYIAGSTVKLLHTTITKNSAVLENQGGGVNNAGSGTEIKNSLLSGNTGGDCRQSSALSANTGNLIRTGNCGTPASSADPLLPASPTVPTDLSEPPAYFPLPSNSPAVNRAGDSICITGITTDQIGTTRPTGSNCDIGAVEYKPAAPTASFTATEDTDDVQTWNFDASDSSGNITSYIWDFGDGNTETVTSARTSHTYTSGGSYTVSLTARGPGGDSSPVTQTIPVKWRAPVASFTAEVDSNNVLQWHFNAGGSSGRIETYDWDFGDGNTLTGQTGPTASHTYLTGGNYTVTLTANGPNFNNRATQNIAVATPPDPPIASFSFSVTGYQVRFTSTSTGSNLSFSWDVDGDGAEDYSDQNPTHTYPSNPATYTVTLTVSNSADSDSDSQRVTVPPPDPPDNGDPPDDGEPDDRRPRRLGTPTVTAVPTAIPTATATFIAATPTATPLTTYTYSVNERIYLQSIYGDIKAQALEMLDLDKHPALQGGRLAVRVWRSNPQCTHRVAGGENLFRLALRYNTTVEALRRHNYLSSELIPAGQELSLPVCPQQMMELGRTWVCFKADGDLVFIDTTSSPPAVEPLQKFTGSGFSCAVIYRPGTVVLTDLGQERQ